MKKVLSSDLHPVFSVKGANYLTSCTQTKAKLSMSSLCYTPIIYYKGKHHGVVLIRNSLRKTMLKKKGSSGIWSDGKYAFISQASGGRYNERSEWSITLYTVT